MAERSKPLRCAFLTMHEVSPGAPDPHPAFQPLTDLGWRCEWLNWRAEIVHWQDWDAVYPAATYDYPQDPTAFLELLTTIDASAAALVNPLALIRWNLSKTYLRELQAAGIAIVPSRWHQNFAGCDLDAEARVFAADRIVVKPVISTNATDTYLLGVPVSASDKAWMARVFASRAFVVQPFVARIQAEGEFSLFYFSATFSHAIRKMPGPDDYRVQEEHGGHVVPYSPDETLIGLAQQLMQALPVKPVYARCDYVPGNGGDYELMELELIEPSLYLETQEGAAARFAAAFDHYVRAGTGS